MTRCLRSTLPNSPRGVLLKDRYELQLDRATAEMCLDIATSEAFESQKAP